MAFLTGLITAAYISIHMELLKYVDDMQVPQVESVKSVTGRNS
jgi:hypothetical protein